MASHAHVPSPFTPPCPPVADDEGPRTADFDGPTIYGPDDQPAPNLRKQRTSLWAVAYWSAFVTIVTLLIGAVLWDVAGVAIETGNLAPYQHDLVTRHGWEKISDRNPKPIRYQSWFGSPPRVVTYDRHGCATIYYTNEKTDPQVVASILALTP